MFHTHTPHHAHTQAQHSHAHHAFMYAKVYSCIYSGRKDHLTKFCYEELIVSNSHVWVRKLTF